MTVRNRRSKLVSRVTTLPLLLTMLSVVRDPVRYRRVLLEFKVVRNDNDDERRDGKICINNIRLYMNVYTHRRVSFQRTSRGSARATSRETGGGGMEPVCNKINRGVARERTHGGAKREWKEREGEGGRKGKRAGAGRGWVARAGVVRQDASALGRRGGRVRGRRAGGEGEGRQNHPAAGYSHPLDEATDCDGVPPSSTTTASSSSSISSSCSSAVVILPSSSLRYHLLLLPFPAAYVESL